MDEIFNIFKSQGEEFRPLESYEYVEYLEEGGGTDEGQLADKFTDLTIRLTDRDLITLPSDSFLQVRYKICQNVIQGNSYAPYTLGNIAPVNNGYNLFKRAQYILGKDIAEDMNRPGYIRQVKGLIEYSDDYERGQGQMEFWFPDRDDGTILGSSGPAQFLDVGGAVLDITGDGNNPHVILIGGTQGNDSAVVFLHRGIQLTVYDVNPANGLRTEIIDFERNGDNSQPRPIDSATAVNGHLLEFYFNDNLLVFEDSNGVGGYFQYDNDQIEFVSADLNDNAFTSMIGEWSHPVFNSGFQKRKNKAISVLNTTGKTINLYMPLRRLFPLLKENPIVMRGIEQELKFDLNDMSKILFRDTAVNGNADGIIRLLRLSWWVPVLKPNLQITNALDNMLKSNETRTLKWNAVQHFYSEPRDSQESTWLIKTTKHRPVRVYVFFQQQAKFSSQLTNNMTFDNYDLRRISISVNAERQYPNKEFRINYAENLSQDYSRVYNTFLNACMAVHSDDCKPAVSFEEFSSLYTFYCFDLTAQDDKVWDNVTQAEIHVDYVLGVKPAEDNKYIIHAILESEKELKIQGVNGRMTRIK